MTAQPTRDQLRALADAATEGPWETFKTSRGRDNGIGSVSPAVPSDEAVMEDSWSDPADAAFIAAARTAIPALLDALDQAEARLQAVLTVVQEWESAKVRHEVAPIMRAASTRIRRALEG